MCLGQPTTNLTRILIKTHHMTSVRKIDKITKAAKKLDCAVLLKTGRPPGVMLAEGEVGKADEWLDVVKNLRYKNFELMKKDGVEERRLDVPIGRVKQLESLKEFGVEVGKDDVLRKWWRLHMGFMKEEDDT